MTDSTTATTDPNKNNNNKKSASSSSSSSSFEYEFGGPIGALATTLILPIVVLVLAHWSNVGKIDLEFARQFQTCLTTSSSSSTMTKNSNNLFWTCVIENDVLCPSCQNDSSSRSDESSSTTTTTTTRIPILYSCAFCIVGWFLFQVMLERLLPCELVEGNYIQNDPSKGKLTYRINGHLAFWVTILTVTIGWPVLQYDDTTNTHRWQLSSAPIELLYEYFQELALVTIILCYGLNTWLYVSSFVPPNSKILAVGGNSGNPFYDFFIGRELNPRIGSTFDWKEFCELRPGLIGWVLLNAACLKTQYNTIGYVTNSMYLVNFFHGLYVWDALYQERAILTTMDITTDGFGFMLLFGDLAWVPFTYSLQARYLVHHDPELSTWQTAIILCIHLAGYSIFRLANGQKDAFRRNPNDPKLKHLTYLQTKRGTKLLTSGWWGMARKINYTGDWLMGLSWCLVCGFQSIVPYYYAIYFAILLTHRSIRDDGMCQEKYGADWDTYKQIVPYRFIPGII